MKESRRKGRRECRGRGMKGSKKRTITPAIELRKTEYAERYDVKLLLSFSRFHGQMQMPTMAAM